MIEFDDDEYLDSDLSDEALLVILDEHGPLVKDRWLKARDGDVVRSSA